MPTRAGDLSCQLCLKSCKYNWTILVNCSKNITSGPLQTFKTTVSVTCEPKTTTCFHALQHQMDNILSKYSSLLLNSDCPNSCLCSQVSRFTCKDLIPCYLQRREALHWFSWRMRSMGLQPSIPGCFVCSSGNKLDKNKRKIIRNVRKKCFSLWNTTSTFSFLVSVIFPCLACYVTKLQVGTLKIPLPLLMICILLSCTGYPDKDT